MTSENGNPDQKNIEEKKTEEILRGKHEDH
jgi:hypothetical protein